MFDTPPDRLRDRLHGLVAEILAVNKVTRPISSDEPLAEAGLGSMDMVTLLLALESEFDVTVPQADITPETFRSVATLEALILRLNASEPGR